MHCLYELKLVSLKVEHFQKGHVVSVNKQNGAFLLVYQLKAEKCSYQVTFFTK